MWVGFRFDFLFFVSSRLGVVVMRFGGRLFLFFGESEGRGRRTRSEVLNLIFFFSERDGFYIEISWFRFFLSFSFVRVRRLCLLFYGRSCVGVRVEEKCFIKE